jgi:hypothetical protein
MPTPSRKSKTSMPDLHNIIVAEIASSGLRASSDFFGGLEGYTKHHKIKGKQAETAKVYLTTAAINIARDYKKAVFGKKCNVLTQSDVLAAVCQWHPPPDDPTKEKPTCKTASDVIQRVERARLKGTMGMLSLPMSRYLDEYKT